MGKGWRIHRLRDNAAMISLIAFLQHGRIGPWRPGADSTPQAVFAALGPPCLLYTSDAADE